MATRSVFTEYLGRGYPRRTGKRSERRPDATTDCTGGGGNAPLLIGQWCPRRLVAVRSLGANLPTGRAPRPSKRENDLGTPRPGPGGA